MRLPGRTLRIWLIFLSLASVAIARAASNGVTINPLTYDFGTEIVGLKTGLLIVQVSNLGSTGVTVTKFQLDSSAFQLTQGVAPIKVAPGAITLYSLLFAPTAAQSFAGTFSVYIDDGQSLVVSLRGTGRNTTAVAALSSTLVNFGVATQGQSVASRMLTVTNVGSESFSLISATTQPPFSIQLNSSKTILPGGSLSLTIIFSPDAVGPAGQLLFLDYDILPAQGVTLKGIVSAASKLAVTSFPTLPGATQYAKYMAYSPQRVEHLPTLGSCKMERLCRQVSRSRLEATCLELSKPRSAREAILSPLS